MLEPYAVKIARTVLRRGGRSNPSTLFDTYKEAARNQELERLVGKLYAENEFLKKALSILEKRMQEEKEMSKVE
jgi:hypothetical protein